MHAFSNLCKDINYLGEDIQLHQRLVGYFKSSNEKEISCAIQLLNGIRPKRVCTLSFLERTILEYHDIPPWLFERSMSISGDICETCSLIVPIPGKIDKTSLSEWLSWIQQIADMNDTDKKMAINSAWKKLYPESRWVIWKLLTGTFRVKVSPVIISNALAEHLELNPNQVARKLSDLCTTEVNNLKEFFDGMDEEYDLSPFPFLPVVDTSPVNFEKNDLRDWLAEYDWDGVRCQVKFGNQEITVWGINGDLLNDRFPEFKKLNNLIPEGTCLEGIIVSLIDDKISPKTHLTTRFRRKLINKKTQEQFPIHFIACDLLEFDYVDYRNKPLEYRRQALEKLSEEVASDLVSLSDEIEVETWDQLWVEKNNSRLLGAGGILLKNRHTKYVSDESWYKFLADPFKMKGVLIYATRGEGGRAAGYAELSLAAKYSDSLLPVIKAPYLPLDDEENDFLNKFIKEHTIERFGPVASLEAELVFNFEFDDIIYSKQRKCGFILKNPRITSLEIDADMELINFHEDFLSLINKSNG